MIDIRWSLDHPELLVGVVSAEPVCVRPASDALQAEIDEAVAIASASPWPPEQVRAATRDLLRRGGFKPTGRSKPASEYLAKAAADGTFPRINNLVDINNLVSLRTGWPFSILDLDLAQPTGAETLEVRFGRKLETYVFNSSGQSIDVAGLICLARADGAPIANAVKDSMETKTRDTTSRVLLIAYVSKRVASEEQVRTVLDGAARLLAREAGATYVHACVLHG